jgi:hypothetical protein
MKETPSHPARSLEFLSRLHDGELSPAESARFESHRSHCAECRRAAAEFETAISLYRTSKTSPASPDLAARILSRLQSANRPRSPFGVVFGIDLRWASAAATALIAVILGYTILEPRRQAATIPVTLATPEAGDAEPAAALEAPSSEPPREEAPPGLPSRQIAESEKKVFARRERQKTAAVPPPASRDEQAAAQEAPEPPRDAAASAPARRPNAAVAGSVMRKEKTAGRAEAELGLVEGVVRIRVVTALDGEGAPPHVVNAEEVSLSPADRGEYVVVVNPQGAVVELDRSTPREERESDSLLAPPPASETLRKLRFAVADRPRRLLLRVE